MIAQEEGSPSKSVFSSPLAENESLWDSVLIQRSGEGEGEGEGDPRGQLKYTTSELQIVDALELGTCL